MQDRAGLTHAKLPQQIGGGSDPVRLHAVDMGAAE